MADEQTQEVEQTEAPQGAEDSTNWKAEARKWESRAKKSEAAEKELAEQKAASMTEQEKAIARAEEAEKKLAEMKAEAEREKAMQEIASAEGVPLELLKYCADVDAMRSFAADFKAASSHIPTVQKSFSTSRIIKEEKQKDADKRQFVRALVGAANNTKE